MNHITLMGRLTRDPELRTTAQGTSVANWTLAVDRTWTKGEEQQTDFIDIVAWRETGEFVSRNFRKGQRMLLNGRLQIRDWTDKDGNKHRTYEVVARDIFFCGDRTPHQSAAPAASPQGEAYGKFETLDEDDGDLPF